MMNKKEALFYPLTLCMLAVVAGLDWDVAWHILLVRESMWQPPHMVMYIAVSVATMLSVYGWWHTRDHIFRKLVIVLFAVPFAAIFDEMWHIVFGEDDMSNIWMALSPPHVMVLLTYIYSAYLVLSGLERVSKNTLQRICKVCAIAVIMNCVLLMALPFDPLHFYSGEVVWTAWVVPCCIFWMMLYTKKRVDLYWSSVCLAVVHLLLTRFSLPANAPGLIVFPYKEPTVWIGYTAYITSAIFMDVSSAYSNTIRTTMAGLLFGSILYGFSFPLLQPEFAYPLNLGVIYIVSAGFGGFLSAKIFSTHQAQRNV